MTLTVGLQENKYDILIDRGLLGELGGLLAPFSMDGAIAVVTDENVWGLYRERFSSSLSRAGIAFEAVVLPAGEANKSLDGLSGLYDAFARISLARGGLVAAFGGGVVGDLCGFAAATWMRGVNFAQVPTTLLAQVDSSVGGKTAINLAHGKNLAGVFYQPRIVVIDPSTLDSLPEREIRCGMAEVIKYGAIRSPGLFASLAQSTEGASPALGDVIGECCRIKSEIVLRDERDFGERMLLNFGHTLGHAIEKQSGFELHRHGEAVAFGMVLAARLGESMGLTEPGTADSLRRALSQHGLDSDYRGDLPALLPALSMDKKSGSGGVRMIMLRRIGEAFVQRVGFDEIKKFLTDASDE